MTRRAYKVANVHPDAVRANGERLAAQPDQRGHLRLYALLGALLRAPHGVDVPLDQLGRVHSIASPGERL